MRLQLLGDSSGAAAFVGDGIGPVTVIASDHALPASGSPLSEPALLVDAAGIAADAEPVVLDMARHATLLLDDNPSMTVGGVSSPDAPVPASLVSLWQTNSRALRTSRRYGFAVIRPDAVQLIAGA